MAKEKVLAIILAGGEGKRLMPLTNDRAKPAVPFGGHFRLIDFALSNMVNSGYLQIVVLTQYKSHSLDNHISRAWSLSPMLGNYVTPMPAQQRRGRHWYLGSADAIYQSLNIVDDVQPDYLVIAGADNIYRMDFSQMVQHHIDSGLDMTVAGIRQPIENASQLGVIEAVNGTVRQFLEKPAHAVGLPDDPTRVLASMGNYVFTTSALVEALRIDSENPNSGHDVGGDIAPWFVANHSCGVYDFIYNQIPGSTKRDRAYWRDVGTIDAYYEANMDLISPRPIFNLYNYAWPTLTYVDAALPPAKFIDSTDGGPQGQVSDCLVSGGVVIKGASVSHSVLSPRVQIRSWSTVRDSVILSGVRVGRHAHIYKAILDKNVTVEDGAQVGLDPDYDRSRGLTVTESGITVAPKGFVIHK